MSPLESREVSTPAEAVAGEDLDAQGRRMCTARRRDGQRCRAPAMAGQRTCRIHGGATPLAKRAARDRLADEADPSIRRLVHERDHAPNAADRIRAANSLLDRAGISRRQAVDVTAMSPSEARAQLLQHLRELRAAQALTEVPENNDIVVAELIDDEEVRP